MLMNAKLLFFLQIMVFSCSHCSQTFRLDEYPFEILTPRTHFQISNVYMKMVYGKLAYLIDDPFMRVVQQDIFLKIAAKREERPRYHVFIQSLQVSASGQKYQRALAELYQDWRRAKLMLEEETMRDYILRWRRSVVPTKIDGQNNPYGSIDLLGLNH